MSWSLMSERVCLKSCLVGAGLLFPQAFDAFAFEGRDEAAVAGVAGGRFLAACLPLIDEVGFADQGAAEGD